MEAFVVPLAPEKVEDWKRWTKELQGSRASDFAAFNRRMDLTIHRAWYTDLPSGPGVIVVCDGPGADRFLERLFDATDPFATWFRERVVDLHGLDPNVRPQDTSELYLDWTDATVTA